MLKIDDKIIVEKLYSHLTNEFPRLRFEIKRPLRELFPEPKNRWLKSFWNNNSHADISVFRHNKLIAIIEPGGWYHAKDKKQKIRDSKKDRICRENKVNCLRILNNIINNDLNNPKFRKLLKKKFYGRVWQSKVR
ncbi:unnamed protein product [marine sediment metagenome]|uniref:DUF559 domain-containing protein n=1 Tax=marine sediment metagenome TaxID=412755 RepID=X1TFI2_9ZZZZ